MAGSAGSSPELSKVRQRLMRMAPQRKALEIALAPFLDDEGAFDSELWTIAFESSDPDDINRCVEVTGGFQNLVNHMTEMLRAVARMTGLGVDPTCPMPELIAAARAAGCFSRDQATALTQLNRVRNRLQHSSPDVGADEVYEAIELMRRKQAKLLQNFLKWSADRGAGIIAA